MFGRKKSYDLNKARDRNEILANAGIASVGTQGIYTPRGSASGAKLKPRQKKLPKQVGYTKKSAWDDAKLAGHVIKDMRSDIVDYAGGAVGALEGIAGLTASASSMYTAGGGIGFGNSDIIGAVKLGHDAVCNIVEWAGNRKAQELPANPLLDPVYAVSSENIKTAAYFKKRMVKKIAGSAVSFTGGILSGATHINTFGAARHGRSDAKTIAHLIRLKAMLKKYQADGLTMEYKLCKLIIDCKKLKIESQSAALAADCIPGNVITSAATTVASFAHGQSLALRLSNMSIHIEKVAKILHYRAVQEMNVDYGLANLFGDEVTNEYETGTPALDMVRELFAQIAQIEKERVIINLGGHKLKFGGEHYRADKLMRESAGWLVIVDKLNLI